MMGNLKISQECMPSACVTGSMNSIGRPLSITAASFAR